MLYCILLSVKYRFIEFFVFDYDSLPCLPSLFFWSGVTFPLVAPDKISMIYAHLTILGHQLVTIL